MRLDNARDVFIFLKSKKYILLLVGVLGFTATLINSIFFTTHFYESSVEMYNTNKNRKTFTSGNEETAVQDIEDEYNIINWVYSSELIEHLIKKFNVYQHYEIDTTDEMHFRNTFNALSENITVTSTRYHAIRITVRDKDRIMAADMANEIVEEVQTLNNKLAKEKREQIVNLYDMLLKDLSMEAQQQRDSIKLIVNTISPLVYKLSGYSTRSKVEELENSLSRVTFNLEGIANDWMSTKKYHLMSMQYLEKFDLRAYSVMKHALPETAIEKYSYAKFVLALLTGMGTLWFTGLLLVLYQTYVGRLRYIISDIPPEPAHNNINVDERKVKIIRMDTASETQRNIQTGSYYSGSDYKASINRNDQPSPDA